MSYFSKLLGYLSTIIHFKDINVKEALLASSDINPDGTRDITYAEAANSSITGAMLKAAINPNNNNTNIVLFDELQYFKNIATLAANTFDGCTNLKSIRFPNATCLNGTLIYNILNNTAIEELHLENISYLQSGTTQQTGSKSKFGVMNSLKVIYITSLTKITGYCFAGTHIPNLEKCIISSIDQWLYMDTTGLNGSRPYASGKASMYLASDPNTPISDVITATQALLGVTTVPTIFDYMFYNLNYGTINGVRHLTTITIGADNTEAKPGAFMNVSSAVTIYNIEKITKIGSKAFDGCKAVGLTNLPPVQSIPDFAFRNSSLQKAVRDTVTTINGMNCFANAPITEVKLDYLTKITGGAIFSTCKSLTQASLDRLTTASGPGTGIFSTCTALTTVSLAAATTIYGSMFYNCTSLVSVNAPNAVIIQTEAFNGCSALATAGININFSNCTHIYERAFASCSYINAPVNYTNLQYIGWAAFNDCIAPSGKYVIFGYTGGVVHYEPGHGFGSDEYYHSLSVFGGKYASEYIDTIYVPDGNLTIDGVTKTYVEWYTLDTEWAKMLQYNPSLSILPISQLST